MESEFRASQILCSAHTLAVNLFQPYPVPIRQMLIPAAGPEAKCTCAEPTDDQGAMQAYALTSITIAAGDALLSA